MTRDKYPTRKILLRTITQKETALRVIENLPLDNEHPLEILIREEVKARKADQNSLMWSGPLKDIAEQAYVNGRTYSAEVWHYWYKREFLPPDIAEPIFRDDGEFARQVKNPETYRKWDIDPAGNRILVGSTTDLTVYGFSQYLEQVMAHGASLGVQFHTVRDR
jgi:hypothetical protein